MNCRNAVRKDSYLQLRKLKTLSASLDYDTITHIAYILAIENFDYALFFLPSRKWNSYVMQRRGQERRLKDSYVFPGNDSTEDELFVEVITITESQL
jgi:hypothetical protein